MSKPAARVAVAVSCGALFAYAAFSAAQPAASPTAASNGRVAVLNLHRIFDETEQIGDLNEKIKKQEADFHAEADRRKKVIETKQTALMAFKPGSQDYETRRKDLVRLNIESNVWLQTTQSDLDRMKFDWTQVIYEKALDIATQIANERGYDAVLQYKEYKPLMIDPNVQAMRRVIQDRDVIFFRHEIDITNEVIRRMDAAYQPTRPATHAAQPKQPASTATPMQSP